VRHATVLATNVVFRWADLRGDSEVAAYAKRACDWQSLTETQSLNSLQDMEAKELLAGGTVRLPTCPACAALLDLALEMRGS